MATKVVTHTLSLVKVIRKETLQQISRDLPTHYREAIEAYFRKLATDGDQ